MGVASVSDIVFRHVTGGAEMRTHSTEVIDINRLSSWPISPSQLRARLRHAGFGILATVDGLGDALALLLTASNLRLNRLRGQTV